jgi:hypothetical protein
MNGCFGNVKGHAWKSMRRENRRKKREKIVSVKPKVYWSHVPPRDGGIVVKIQTLP